jgi:hypothetical protein
MPATDEDVDVKTGVGRSNWVLWSAAAILALYAIFVFILWSLGLLDFESNDDSQTFAAVLGLLGGMFASSLTFIGLLIKHSVDERSATLAEQTERRLQLEADRNNQLANETARRLQLEADRNNQLAKEAEDRLKLDTSLKAVDLLSAPRWVGGICGGAGWCPIRTCASRPDGTRIRVARSDLACPWPVVH